MLQIDFKLIDDWANPQDQNELNIQSIPVEQLYGRISRTNATLRGGYCISINNEAWNGYWDDKSKQTIFFINNIQGAIQFLKAITYFNSRQVTVGTCVQNIWQCDGSSLEIQLTNTNTLSLQDEVFECDRIFIDRETFIHQFHATSQLLLEKLQATLQHGPMRAKQYKRIMEPIQQIKECMEHSYGQVK